MVLAGKLSTEIGIKTLAAKFYNNFKTQLDDVHNHCERVHETKLLEGDWHDVGALKHWTYVIDGKVHTSEKRIVAFDDGNKTVKWSLLGGDISSQYNTFTVILQVIENINDVGAAAKWTAEYEKLHEDIEPPHGWMDFLNKCTRDIDNANLLKAQEINGPQVII